MASTGGDDEGLISNINVTPLVDVTLVVLIIFLVTAPMIVRKGMAMDLPKTASGETIQSVFSVELTREGKTLVDGNVLADDAALRALAQKAKTENAEVRATIRADQQVPHGQVMHVLDELNQAGISKIAFAVAPKTDVAPAPPAPGGTPPKPAPTEGSHGP